MQRNVGRRLCRSGYSMELRLQSWSLPREPCDVCASLPRQQRVLLVVLHTGVTDFAPFRSVAGECLPVSWVYASGLHVSLQLISVALQWATKESENRTQVPSIRQPSGSCCQAFYAHGQPSKAAPEEWKPLCRRCRLLQLLKAYNKIYSSSTRVINMTNNARWLSISGGCCVDPQCSAGILLEQLQCILHLGDA